MPFGKLKKLFIEDDDEGLPKKNLPVVSLDEEETIKELLNPPKRKVVKITIRNTEDVRKMMPFAQSNDLIIIDLRKMMNKPNELQKVAHKIEGIATATGAVVVRISGCDAVLMMVPGDMEIHKIE